MHLLAYLPDADDPDLVIAARPGARGPQRPGARDPRPTCARWGSTSPRTTYGASPPARRPPAGRTSPTRSWPAAWSPSGRRRSSGTSTPAARGTPRRYAADLEDVVPLVVAAGGVPVVAHPWGRGRRGRCSPRPRSRGCRDLGLAGIEVDHQDHDAAARERAARDRRATSTSSSPGPATTTARARSTTTSAATPPRPRSSPGSASSPTRAPRGRRGRSMSDLVDTTLLTSAFVTLFVIMDPVGTVPIFLSLTGGRSKAERAPGGVAGGRRLVRGDHGVRLLRPADPGLPAHLAARPAVRGRPAAPARRPRAADRQREGADPAGRHQRRARPARHPAARRPRRDRRDDAVLQPGPRLRRLRRRLAGRRSSSTCASGPRCATPCRSSG